jgi:nucleoside-diphosphate-sugar epimerase
LFHLAWYLEPGKYMNSASNIEWLGISLDLVMLFRKLGGIRVVGAGTCYEYEWSQSRLSEDSPTKPTTTYGHGKRLLFEALKVWEECGGPELAWGRPFFLFGPGEDRRRLIGDVVSSLLLNQEVPTSSGLFRRDYMYVEDAGQVFAALVDSNLRGVVNVATGNAIPIFRLVDAFAQRIGRPELVLFGSRPTPPGEPECVEADVTRLTNELGWTTLTSLSAAVDRTVKWWEDNLEVRQS